jgi:membrane protease YdiL (CAAX protease family)
VTSTATVPTSRVRWYDLLIAFIGGNALGVSFVTIVALVALAVAAQHGFHPTAENIAALAGRYTKDFWANHIILVLSDLGFAIVIWLMARWRFARPIGHFFAPVSTATLALAALSGAALSLLVNGGNALLEYCHLVHFENVDVELALVPHTPAQFATTFAVVALFAPFVEEYFFRGLFFAWARDLWGRVGAMLITAAGFAVAHGHLLVHPGTQGAIFTVELFLAGIVLAWWASRAGSLRASLATHAAYNAAAIVFSVLIP